MQTRKILIVDDEPTLRTALNRVLGSRGYKCISAGNVDEARQIAKAQPDISLALIDLRLPDGDGIELMAELKAANDDLQVIILTGFGTIDTAVRATKNGAFHFVTKPFNLEEINSVVLRAFSHSNLEAENKELKKELSGRYKFDNIIGQSEGIRNVLSLVERVADSDSTVLVTGESGTGKELIARAVHFNSPRKSKAFVPINCGAIPGELLESELFGHVKGAFTGAVNNRTGRFELANGGTLFLDEIGELSLNLQVKLLRVLQERRFEPVGSVKTIEADVRIIAATNINLEKAVKEGKFREDLYYRLNVIPIKIPSLKERREDIPLLIKYFIDSFNKTKSRNLTGVSAQALEYLSHYEWPGNIRELENFVERAAILKGQGNIEIDDLPSHMQDVSNASLGDIDIEIPDIGLDFNSAVDAYENALILQALEKTGWNRNQAAILLKLNRTTLVEKIKKKGLKPTEATA